jgi:hypothetical protein
LDDENTHFFILWPQFSHKRNHIVCLTNANGNYVVDHDKKANLIWIAFKMRLGISEFQGMVSNLNTLLIEHKDNLDADFSHEEIDAVIKNLPNSHAPGPDGLNGMFIKKCWHIF